VIIQNEYRTHGKNAFCRRECHRKLELNRVASN
jgi:hypothetical protein